MENVKKPVGRPHERYKINLSFEEAIHVMNIATNEKVQTDTKKVNIKAKNKSERDKNV